MGSFTLNAFNERERERESLHFLVLEREMEVVWFVAIWPMWLHYNPILFNNEPMNAVKVIETMKLKFWLWLSAKC